MGRGACPAFGPIAVNGATIRVEIRTDCPFTPPPEEPFTLVTTLDPLDPGTYDLVLALPDDTVLATSQLEVLDQAGCVPSSPALCLNENRFRVEVDFRASNGQAGQGQGEEYSDDSGLFTFFDLENLELIVKVLDRCGSSFNSFWVFSAGLTNVEVDLTVTETETGEVRTYLNPLGTPYEVVLDTRAFETCP